MNTTEAQTATSLSISCVIYDTDVKTLSTTIESLYTALEYANQQKVLSSHTLYLINNNADTTPEFRQISQLAVSLIKTTKIITGHGNIGYGKANNLAIHQTENEFHLILNPDVQLHPTALYEGISYLITHPDTELVAPDAFNIEGNREYLAKRLPSPLIIFLRGLNKKYLNKVFQKQLNNYAYKDTLPTQKAFAIELASGCFMLCRTAALKNVRGFSPEFFLYFEDFDLSRKLQQKILLPSMKIIHLGGNTAGKGLIHIKFFLKSYWVFLKLEQKRKLQ